MYVATTESGQAMAPADVCKVPAPPGPPIPTPFPNLGMMATADPSCSQVLITNMPVVTKAAKLNPSQGDEAGVNGGLTSGKIMGKIEFTTASQKVKCGGNPLVYMSCQTQHNEGNTVGSHLQPSQLLVTVSG